MPWLRTTRRAAQGIRLRTAAEKLRASLWFVPSVLVTAAVVLAAVLSRVDINASSPLSGVVFPGGAASARAILQAIAGSVITVTGVVFSLTVVTLQLASTQFSPRLLRTFLRDVSNQVVLGIFLATFSYALVVLRAVETGSSPVSDVVPPLAVTGAYLLTAASVVALVYFIDHIARAIRIDSLMREVNEDTRIVLDRVHPHDAGTVTSRATDEVRPPVTAVVVTAAQSGFLQGVDHRRLLAAAVAADVVVALELPVGERVIEGTPLARVWRPACSDTVADVADEVRSAVAIGYERTMAEDVAFGFRQLVDVAVKALSPGVNDPTTAVHALAHLTALLVVLAGRHVAPHIHCDESGVVRAITPARDLGVYLDLACGQIRRYGAAEPAVTTELLRMLLDVAGTDLTSLQLEAVRREADLVAAAAERHTAEPRDLGPLRDLHARVLRRTASTGR